MPRSKNFYSNNRFLEDRLEMPLASSSNFRWNSCSASVAFREATREERIFSSSCQFAITPSCMPGRPKLTQSRDACIIRSTLIWWSRTHVSLICQCHVRHSRVLVVEMHIYPRLNYCASWFHGIHRRTASSISTLLLPVRICLLASWWTSSPQNQQN